jgi:hypothetical protein
MTALDTAQRRAQLQCQSADDFAADGVTKGHWMQNDGSWIGEPQREILSRMGFALLFMQSTEELIRACLTLALPEGGVITLEMLSRPNLKKRTLGQFLVELRKRVDIDDQFDMILAEFLEKRNTLIHRLDDVPGWSLHNEEGLKIARLFVDRVIILNRSVFDVFMALLSVWQKDVDIKTPVDHMFCYTESYRQVVNNTFFEKE